MKTGTKIALLIGGIAVVGVGAYFIMKSVKKAKEKKEAEKKAAEEQSKVGFADIKNPLRLIPNTQPLGFGAQKGGINNLSLYDKDAFKKNMADFRNQNKDLFPKKYDPNFLLNQKPLSYKPISMV